MTNRDKFPDVLDEGATVDIASETKGERETDTDHAPRNLWYPPCCAPALKISSARTSRSHPPARGLTPPPIRKGPQTMSVIAQTTGITALRNAGQ